MFEDIKVLLRINNTAYDTEIQDLIDAAVQDLILSGVHMVAAQDYTDPLIKRAISIYVKTNFGYDNPDAEKLQKSYDMLKTHLALSGEYNGYSGGSNVI